jgi:hypothetical protein
MLIGSRTSHSLLADAGLDVEREQATTTSLSRNDLFAGLALVGFANGITERMSLAVSETGLATALVDTFGISVIVWTACSISLAFLLRGPVQPVRHSDRTVATFSLLAFLVPIGPLSWLAIVGLAIHILRTSPRSSHLQRGAWILLALTVPMFWSRLLFVILSEFILQADATLVGWLVGTSRVGNAVQFVDGSGYLWIAPRCSSLANISLAILCWVTVTKALDRPSSLWHVGWVALACMAVITINVTRVSLMGLYPDHFDLIHGPVGATMANWLTLGVTVAICLIGAGRNHMAKTYSGFNVTFRPALHAGFGLVLAVSLLLKLLGFTQLTGAAVPAPVFPGEVAKLLERHGFQISQVTPADDLAWVSGTAGDCQVRITEVAPQGWQRSLMAEIARDHQLIYLFGGQTDPEQPISRTQANYYLNKVNRYLGLSAPSRPVLAVISTPTCEHLPLKSLAAVSAI